MEESKKEKELEVALEEKTTEGKHCNCNSDKNENRKISAGSSCIYGLGFIGAAIFFIGKAASFGAGVLGFFKALVWPALLVYEVFKYLVK